MFRVDHRLKLFAIGGLIAAAGVLAPSGVVGAVPPVTTISLEKTVMVDTGSDECGTETSLTVGAGTTVRYCYTLTNEGNTPVDDHTLVDDQVGTILTGFAFFLDSGERVSVTVTDIVYETVTNTAPGTRRRSYLPPPRP